MLSEVGVQPRQIRRSWPQQAAGWGLQKAGI